MAELATAASIPICAVGEDGLDSDANGGDY